MRILFVTPFFHPHKGGGELYAEELLSALVHRDRKLEVDVLCYNTQKAPPLEQRSGLTIHRIACFNLPVEPFTLPNPISLIKELVNLRHRGYQFVFTQTRFFDATWWVWLYAKFVGAKSVFVGHGTAFVSYPNWVVRGVARLVDLTLARLSLRFYDHVVVISQATSNFYRNYLGVQKPVLIYGGIDTKRIVRSRQVSSQLAPGTDRKIPQGARVITYVGRLTWAKGVVFLYEAFRQLLLQGDGEALYLVIAGDGPLKQSLKKRVKGDELSDRVFLPGDLELDLVYDLLLKSDIFVNPSHNEGLPRTVMEAAVAGCLVIATDVGATGEIIEDKKTGLLIAPQSVDDLTLALRWVLTHPRAVGLMKKKAKRKVEQEFDWRVISGKFHAQILSL